MSFILLFNSERTTMGFHKFLYVGLIKVPLGTSIFSWRISRKSQVKKIEKEGVVRMIVVENSCKNHI